jgi:hypothetical protein
MELSEKLFKAIGQPVRRKEDIRLLTGGGRFSDDFSLPGQAYAAVARSPHPHAKILGVDTSAARTLPGVLGIFTGRDIAEAGLAPIPHSPVPATKYDMKLTAPGGGAVPVVPHFLLPADKTRYVGEAVAMVVAETAALALDGVEAVQVDYEELLPVIDAATAAEPGRPAVWDEVANNALVDTVFGDVEATDAAFADARMLSGPISMSAGSPAFRSSRARRSPLTMPRRDATRFMPAAAARCARRATCRRCSASIPTISACCPTMSAAISAPATRSMSNSVWCSGRRACSGVRSSTRRAGRSASKATIRAETCSRASNWRSTARAGSWQCAPTISAIAVRFAYR